ncbi:pyruvate carboxylase [Synchytrium endobioticum]|uniref:Pyruvate carboxylase n=1 Tax=Synchytrium endobioticum TaxID=286115 RepID=A0A507DGL9_9FUNG|nr:pyruvate carboxylase [Synchytrium endobioticum]TPX53906.1 pyruvate carboxylase [Synchytrium endobioticum]
MSASRKGSLQGLDILSTLNATADVPRVLVANRGEIAIRVIRAARELGWPTVAVYSHEDRLSMHRYKADESYQIGEVGQYTPVGAYLAVDELIKIAKARNVQVIHPGYGFLSENALFARKVEATGIAFAGPRPEVIDSCGDKTKAREVAIQCGVPVVPGTDGPVSALEEAEAFIKKAGLPVIIKAAMGGGGRGMRTVRNSEDFPHLFRTAQSEALNAFGDGTMFIERLIEKPRHIEVQLLGDAVGNVIHLFERDCSVQRRHQKVVEQAPSLGLPDDVRQAILADAVKIAKHVNYRNAGTAEFLVDAQNRHYFIEINPRIQVEHTVTEEICGIDLVAAQLQIATGVTLPQLGLSQDVVTFRGYAIQARVTTEDTSRNFQPDTGRIELYRSPGGPGVRLDGGPGYTGAVITPHYDSLLVKVTCLASDFESCRRKMLRALLEFRVRGVKTNIPFVMKLLTHPTFVAGGKVWTTFIDDNKEELLRTGDERDRGQRLLRYLGEMVVNGSKIEGQEGPPGIQGRIPISSLPGLSAVAAETPCQAGWRHVLITQGPEAFCRKVRAHKGALLMDTTWRDAHQSLLATRVRTTDISRIAPLTSHALANAFALECWGGATFDVAMRFLHEDPWERLHILRQAVPNIPFSMLLRGASAVGYTNYPDNVVYEFCRLAKLHGVDIFRVFDALNYVPNLLVGIDAARKAGGVAEGAISYTGACSNLNAQKYNLKYWMDLVDKLVEAGIHILGIKDMAGLLTPHAATLLVGTIRKKYQDLAIHIHTHDTVGTGVATYIACIAAGADIVDVAVDSMSGMTSQPSMGAIVANYQRTDQDTGISFDAVQTINAYWTQVRRLYQCFDPKLLSGDSSVLVHQMPGGQYTNLLFQAQSLGLGKEWEEIKKAYVTANLLCGDIVKVTPSSKVVGDFAQFIVQNKLTEEDIIRRCEDLSFPKSVVDYYQGWLGQPPYGFPEPLRSRILKSRKLTPITDRPGLSMPPMDLAELKRSLEDDWGEGKVSETDVISAALYPQVFKEYRTFLGTYGDLINLPTYFFLTPLKIGEEFYFELETGKTLIVNLLAVGPVNEATGKRDIYFAVNGEGRVVAVKDDESDATAQLRSVRRKADPNNNLQLGAPMAGVVVDVRVKVGSVVNPGDIVVVLSAMKLETSVAATSAGKVAEVLVDVGDSVAANDLLIKIVKP